MAEHPAQRWAETWRRAWEAGDADALAALYAPHATFSSEPFRVPSQGPAGVREYARGAFASESEVRARFGSPLIDGAHAAVEWWATLREGGEQITLAGTSVLRFDGGGMVVEQRDTWNQIAGWQQPPEGWGAPGLATD